MILKNFQYISRSKVESITGQIESGFSWSKINPKIEGFGLGIGLDIELGKSAGVTEDLVRKTIGMLKHLKKSQLIIPLQEEIAPDESKMYQDEGEWFHGLYSVQIAPSRNKQIITYVLWKSIKNRIFLLLGSPLNVLGSKEVHEGAKHDMSSSQILGDMLDEAITNPFVEALQNKKLQTLNESVFINVDSGDQSGFQLNVQNWMNVKRLRTKVDVFRGTALAVFCHEALRLLPLNRMDILFRIHQTLPVSRSVVPYDVLHIGSPIYTAMQ
jgi:hypothetical protein